MSRSFAICQFVRWLLHSLSVGLCCRVSLLLLASIVHPQQNVTYTNPWSPPRRATAYRDKKPSCRYGGPTVPFISDGQPPASDFRSPKKSDLLAIMIIHAMVALLYRTLQSTLRYYMVIRRTWVMTVGRNLDSKLRPDRQTAKHGYYWQPIEIIIALFNGTVADPLRRTV